MTSCETVWPLMARSRSIGRWSRPPVLASGARRCQRARTSTDRKQGKAWTSAPSDQWQRQPRRFRSVKSLRPVCQRGPQNDPYASVQLGFFQRSALPTSGTWMKPLSLARNRRRPRCRKGKDNVAEIAAGIVRPFDRKTRIGQRLWIAPAAESMAVPPVPRRSVRRRAQSRDCPAWLEKIDCGQVRSSRKPSAAVAKPKWIAISGRKVRADLGKARPYRVCSRPAATLRERRYPGQCAAASPASARQAPRSG